MKKLLIAAIVLAGAFSSCNKLGGSAAIKSETDSLSNAMGTMLGAQLKGFKGVEFNTKIMAKAMQQVLDSKDNEMEGEIQKANEYFRNFMMVTLPAKMQKENKDFLAKKETESGVMKTESGLLYKIDSEGDVNAKPQPTDSVTVNYKGTTVDGEEFDSSYSRNAPATFQLNQVIPGWTEGLQLIGKGGKMTLYIPAELAYGANGPLANQVLIFDVELLDVKPSATK